MTLNRKPSSFKLDTEAMSRTTDTAEKRSDILEMAPGTVLFREGDESTHAYVILEGRMELIKDAGGTKIRLSEIGKGDLFGEMGLIDGGTRSATAVTLEATVLQQIDKTALLDKLGEKDGIAAPVISQLVRQLRNTSDRLAHEQVQALQRAADASDVYVPAERGVFKRLTGFFDADQDLIEFQPDAVEIDRRRTPPIAKVMLYVIFAFVVGAFVWANHSSVDTAVSAMGRVTTQVPNILVQPSATSIIRSIQVKEGQVVKKGQLLATLDATVAEAGVTASRATLASVSAQEKRLEAELAGALPENGFSSVKSVDAIQQEIFKRRQATLKDRLASFDEQIAQIKADIRTNTQDARDLGEQSEVLVEIEKMRAQLLKSGHGSRVNYLSAKHQRLSIDREKRRLQSHRSRLQHTLRAIQADRGAELSSWKSQVAEELVAIRQQREGITEQLTRTEHNESMVRLTAPAPGVVLKIAARSVGSVIKQAEPMFTIVPANVPMEMEVDVAPKDVGLIQVGDVVRVKLDALPFQKHGIVEGKVRLISEDAVPAETGNSSVYRTRIEITERQLRNVPDSFRFTPGLTGSADITVGSRKIITYFVYPLVRAMDSSFREP